MSVPNSESRLIIAIDGPAASGKSTVGRMLADRLGYLYIDTGALYRAVAWLAQRENLSGEDPPRLAAAILETDIRLVNDHGTQRVLLNDCDISGEIRSEEIGHLASSLSALPAIRRALLDLQRRLGADGGVVMDGRDIGTVIFPEADVKFFLTASSEERSRRRWLELKERDTDASLEDVREDLIRRDNRDRGRAHAPLRPAPDSIRIDSTGMSPESVQSAMWKAISAKKHDA